MLTKLKEMIRKNQQALVTDEQLIVGRKAWRLRDIESVDIVECSARHLGGWVALDERTVPGTALAALCFAIFGILLENDFDFIGRPILIIIFLCLTLVIFERTWELGASTTYRMVL